MAEDKGAEKKPAKNGKNGTKNGSKVDKVIDTIVSPIDKIDKHKVLDSTIKNLLSPVNMGFKLMQKIAKKTHESVPLVYEQVESFIKSHIITVGKDGKLDDPDLEVIGDLISSNIINKLPNIDREQMKKILEEKSSSSYLKILDRAISGDRGTVKDYTVLSKKNMFKKILVANRGEIAIRIIRACRELGIKVIVVYSDADKESLAVKFADEAHNIGKAASSESYLNTEKIMEIAKKTKVDAIHPGYGFLAENADFAETCEKSRIRFIGPRSTTIRDMGDKIIARDTIKKVNVPVIEGTEEAVKDKDEVISYAEEIGYPVIIKASAGGGGKGMRIVRSKDEIIDAYTSAKMEAKSAFGNESVYIEKFIEEPRHIEFQILADRYGNIVHLGERECSIQRKHQKLIEEAPSQALTPELRKKMGDAAVAAATAAHYEGAGTIEFLLDKNNEFYFMEMNTRIQVEHGVTEMVTGLDLIKEQIKIASGALLAMTQDDVKVNGWAIECRINAENPLKDFAPSPGTITNYLPPGGPGIRVCSCSHVGHIISSHYDSMISKLIVKGENREDAVSRMKRALEEYIIEGTHTTIPFHLAVMSNKNFIKGKIDTSFIENNNIMKYMAKSEKQRTKEDMINRKTAAIIGVAAAKYMKMKKSFITTHSARADSWVMAGRFGQIDAHEPGMERFR